MTDEEFERFMEEIKTYIKYMEDNHSFKEDENPFEYGFRLGNLEAIGKIKLKLTTMNTSKIAKELKTLLDKGWGSKETVICSAFPGTGKTTFHNRSNLVTLDSDSSKFDKSDFPANYMKHIKENMGKVDIIFVSSHKEVREALVEHDMKFVLVYPTKSQRENYMNRYEERGSDISFIARINDNWYTWIEELGEQKGCDHIVLPAQQYLIDAEENLMRDVE